jgi:hypothetical protein
VRVRVRVRHDRNGLTAIEMIVSLCDISAQNWWPVSVRVTVRVLGCTVRRPHGRMASRAICAIPAAVPRLQCRQVLKQLHHL